MHWEINVSKNGGHYFGTHKRSLRISEEQAKRVALDLQKRFPESEGFKVSLTFWESSGRDIKF